MIQWMLRWLSTPRRLTVPNSGLCAYCGTYASAPGSFHCAFMGCDRFMDR